jgi:hypothetical protein
MSNANFGTNDRALSTVKTSLGTDLNYSPFSSWYGSVKEKLASSNEITETLFFQALEHIGAVSRNGSQTLPPHDIYQVMKGRDGMVKNSWYCKKNSNISGKFIESYGICLDEITHFERKYLQPMLDILNDIEEQVAIEKEDADIWLAMKKETATRDRYRRLSAQAKSMVKEAKEYIIRDAFKEKGNI